MCQREGGREIRDTRCINKWYLIFTTFRYLYLHYDVFVYEEVEVKEPTDERTDARGRYLCKYRGMTLPIVFCFFEAKITGEGKEGDNTQQQQPRVHSIQVTLRFAQKTTHQLCFSRTV